MTARPLGAVATEHYDAVADQAIRLLAWAPPVAAGSAAAVIKIATAKSLGLEGSEDEMRMSDLLMLTTPVMRVGYALLLASAVPGIMAWVLALQGLGKVSKAADQAHQVAKQATEAIAQAQPATALATGEQAQALAALNTEVATRANAVTDAVGDVRDSLNELTGVFAPTRAFLAIAVLLLTAALVALNIISVG